MSFGHDLTRDTNFATSRQEPSLGLTAPRSLLAYDSRDGGARSVGGEAGGAQFLWAADARADPGRYCGGPESRRSGAPRPLLRHGQARPEPAIRSAREPAHSSPTRPSRTSEPSYGSAASRARQAARRCSPATSNGYDRRRFTQSRCAYVTTPGARPHSCKSLRAAVFDPFAGSLRNRAEHFLNRFRLRDAILNDEVEDIQESRGRVRVVA